MIISRIENYTVLSNLNMVQCVVLETLRLLLSLASIQNVSVLLIDRLMLDALF